MSKRVHRFLPFSLTTSLHLKAHLRSCSHASLPKAVFVFHTETTHPGQLRTPTRPLHVLSSSARFPLSLSTPGSLLYNCCWLLLK
ncbi:unnamed protein product [Hymenolepis diminuta]|uniref:Uncharacterized protein n=1 Tax=Hymenolepis diminuta TaxID=6216 RepID=A0A564Z818_HYMDI|nr:unnamed protein product [Hymenolepis diminuta]